jgi:hypothetical protein
LALGDAALRADRCQGDRCHADVPRHPRRQDHELVDVVNAVAAHRVGSAQ